MSDYKSFVVPFDFSDHARAALSTATDLARRLGADLDLIHVVQPVFAYGYAANVGAGGAAEAHMQQLTKRALESLDKVAGEVDPIPGRIRTQIVEGPAIAVAIQQAAREIGADLIVMGTHGRTGLAHVFLGSVAERTLRNAPCPVMTVQASEATE